MIERYREIRRQKAAGEREEGFTLIELLIVIVVLGILAAVVVFALGGVTGKSANSACNSDARTVETAVGAYEANNNGSFPAASSTTGTGTATVVTETSLLSSANGGPYLHSWPSNATNGYAITLDASGNVSVLTNLSAATPTSQAFDSQSSTNGCNTANL